MYVSGSSSTYDISFYLQQKVKNQSKIDPSDQTNVEKEVSSNKNISKSYRNVSQTESNADLYDNKGKVSQKSNIDGLTEEEKQSVEKLKLRDQEVRSHEQAHLAAAGYLAKGSAQFTYETGPDGRQYAVGGSVDIDTSRGKTPEETVAKAQIIKNAALAPQNPSAQDRKVAQEAGQMEAEARAESAHNKQQGFQAYGMQKAKNNNETSSINNKILIPENNNSESKIEETSMSTINASKLDIKQDLNYSPVNFFA